MTTTIVSVSVKVEVDLDDVSQVHACAHAFGMDSTPFYQSASCETWVFSTVEPARIPSFLSALAAISRRVQVAQ